MDWANFHHPDLSPTVLRRRAADEFLDLVDALGEVLVTQGRSATNGWNYPSQTAYHSALYRLKKRGLIADRPQGGKSPRLKLTPDGRARRPEAFRPERHWNRKWSGRWYVLSYDIPESERPYRAAVRGFLRQMRMGCLHGSVWVSPVDIRPEFEDLVQAGGLGNYAFLFEARTVLGQLPREVVEASWDFEALRDLQADYCRTSQENIQRLQSVSWTPEQLCELTRRELAAYLRVMRDDPLLPRALWPSDYCGPDVYACHRTIIKEIRAQL